MIKAFSRVNIRVHEERRTMLEKDSAMSAREGKVLSSQTQSDTISEKFATTRTTVIIPEINTLISLLARRTTPLAKNSQRNTAPG